MTSVLHTRICDLFGIQYPIVQTGMGWVAGPRLCAATSTAGGLGILASATMTFPQLTAAVKEVKARTDRPFGVNLRTDQADIKQRVQLLIDEKVKVASFAQAPNKEKVIAGSERAFQKVVKAIVDRSQDSRVGRDRQVEVRLHNRRVVRIDLTDVIDARENQVSCERIDDHPVRRGQV